MKKERDLVTISEIINYISQENKDIISYVNNVTYNPCWYFPDEYKNEYKSIAILVNSADEKLKLRARRWLDFFYNKFPDSIFILDPTIFVIFDEAISSKLFYNQTNYEVSLSFKFYENYFKTKRSPLKYNYEMASYLFKTSLFYSKYYGLQQQPLVLAFDKINEDFSLNGMVEMFFCLFCKYQIPKALLKYFTKLKDEEHDVLSQIILGKNLREIEELPLKMSKKENFVFLNKIPYHIDFEDNHLKRLLVFSKILKLKVNESDLAEDLLAYSNTFKHRLPTFIEDLSFWQDAFLFLTKVDCNLNVRIREFVDFFEYHRYLSQGKPFSFKGRTVNSVIRLIEEWHDLAKYQKNLELLSKVWEKIGKSDFRTEYNGEQFIFKQINNGKDLYKESKVLKHCVFSYIQMCIDGYTSIWSMQKITNNDNERILTIEIRNNEITQVSGKYNRKMTSDERTLLTRFAEFNNLKISDYYTLYQH